MVLYIATPSTTPGYEGWYRLRRLGGPTIALWSNLSGAHDWVRLNGPPGSIFVGIEN